MASQDVTTEGNAGTVPIACALTSADLAAQTGRWEQLAARAMTERAETAHGLRLCFRPGAGVEEELRKLVAVENECCPWADWTVETNPQRIVLDVHSTDAGIATLHGMFTNLQPGGPAAAVWASLGAGQVGYSGGKPTGRRSAVDLRQPRNEFLRRHGRA